MKMPARLLYGVGVAQLAPGQPLGLPVWMSPEPGVQLRCGLCDRKAFTLWPLATSRELIEETDPPGLMVCQLCVDAIRPCARPRHLTLAVPA